VNGKNVLKPEVQKLMKTNRNEYDRVYGADDAYWMLQNNVMQDQWLSETDSIMSALKDWTVPYTKYTGQYEVVFNAGSSNAQIDKKIKEEWGKTLPLLLLAKSEEEFDAIFQSYKLKKYDMGFEQLLQEYTKSMLESKQKLGLD